MNVQAIMKTMKPLLVLVAALAFSAGAAAQMYKWKDNDGRMQYGDTPPPGVDATPMRGAPASGPAPSAPAAKGDAKSEKPLSPEAAFRKRQADREAADEKAAKEQAQADQKRANCEQAQAQLRTLESGVRIATVNAQGERVIMEDDQRAAATQRAQKAVADYCN
jgi:hypothetical protein